MVADIYLATTHKKGISSVQIATDLGITQKTAWFVLHRIREIFKDKAPRMLDKNSMQEADEAYIGGKENSRHYIKRPSNDNGDLANDGIEYKPKKVVIGVIERNGNVV